MKRCVQKLNPTKSLAQKLAVNVDLLPWIPICKRKSLEKAALLLAATASTWLKLDARAENR